MTVLRDCVGCGSYFLCFELAKDKFSTTPGGTLLAGACAGVGFWATALPFDAVKTRVQIGGPDVTARAVLKDVYRKGDFVGLWRGWQVALGRGAPGAAITLVAYSHLMKDI